MIAPGVAERYLVRELAQTFLGVLTVLVIIALSNTLALTLIKVAEGRIAADSLAILLALKSVALITVLVPMGLMLGIVLAFGRLYRDSEMTALMACGIGPARIYRAVALLGIPLVIGLSWFALYGMPWASRLSTEFTHKAKQTAGTSLTSPGQFRELDRGRITAYAENVDRDGQLHNVFIRGTQDQRQVVTTASSGRQRVDPETGARYLVLEHGLRVTGEPGQADVEILRFETLQVLIDEDEEAFSGRYGSDEKPLRDLIGSDLPADVSELHWRIAIPVSACLVMLIGPPMAHSRPREGRYLRVVVSILIFVVYSNLLGIGRAWLESGEVPAGFGLWWVHLLVLLVGAVVLFSRGPYAIRFRAHQPVRPGTRARE
jgi:lipopolysaccharide export system permease protein